MSYEKAKQDDTAQVVQFVRELVRTPEHLALFESRLRLALKRSADYCAVEGNDTVTAWPELQYAPDGGPVVMVRVGRNASHWFHVAVDSEGNFYAGAYCPEDFDDPDWTPGDCLKPVDFDEFRTHRIYVGHY